MPNWCINQLSVAGPAKEVAKFFKEAKAPKTAEGGKTDLSLAKLVPIPADEEGNWYDWCVENWGTKWDLSEVDGKMANKAQATYDFHSAWAPPQRAIQTISGLYPKLTFTLTYDEPGMAFDGEVVFKAGIITSEEFDQGGDYTGRIMGLPEEDEDEA
jgi:hypothetical protein